MHCRQKKTHMPHAFCQGVALLAMMTVSTLVHSQCRSSKHAANATLFAPGVIATAANEMSLSLTPDGDTAYFVRTDFAERDNVILQSTLGRDQHWRTAKIAPFSGIWRDSEPSVSPDGRYLYFSSNRTINAQESLPSISVGRLSFPGARLWRVAKSGNSWGEPELLGGAIAVGFANYNPSVAADGTLYFSSKRPEAQASTGPAAASAIYQLYQARPMAGQYGAVTRVALAEQTLAQTSGAPSMRPRMDPAIDPERRFLLYASDEGDSFGSADIYLRVREANGVFGAPIHLAAPVNTPFLEHAVAMGRAFGEIFVTSDRLPETPYPKTKSASAKPWLTQALNGARNVWRFDISQELRALGIVDTTCLKPKLHE
jgi:hypothetical protein